MFFLCSNPKFLIIIRKSCIRICKFWRVIWPKLEANYQIFKLKLIKKRSFAALRPILRIKRVHFGENTRSKFEGTRCRNSNTQSLKNMPKIKNIGNGIQKKACKPK